MFMSDWLVIDRSHVWLYNVSIGSAQVRAHNLNVRMFKECISACMHDRVARSLIVMQTVCGVAWRLQPYSGIHPLTM